MRINHLHRDRDEMQQRLLDLKGENDKLKREITALQSDRRYLESIARRDFGLVRSNEVIYQFPPQEKAPSPQDAGQQKVGQKVDRSGEKLEQKADNKPDPPAAASQKR